MFNFGLVMGLPLLAVLALEIVYRGSFSGTVYWLTHHPIQFLATYLLLFGIINIFYVLPRKIYVALGAILTALLGIIGLISRQKLTLRGEPLLPSDVLIGREALNISQQFGGLSPDLYLIAIGLVVGFIFYALRNLIPPEPYSPRRKIAVGFLAAALLMPFYTDTLTLQDTFSLRLINWHQKMNYDENGMLLGFILNTKYLSVDAPANYGQNSIRGIAENTETAYSVDSDSKPNIIFVMSEAFWDPTLLKEVQFNQDPIPYFHSLQADYTTGMMLSPVYGGGTANTEFEVLTGFSTQFLPQGVVPYAQYIHKPIEALPTTLKKQGYETTAIHTYDNWYYQRNAVYREFGFDRYISKEFFDDPEYGGQYIRDTELTKRILTEMEKTEEPDFIYAVSMQAHGPYPAEENPANTIEVSGNLSDESKAILENYAQTIADVDQSLKLLIEGLEETGEPTILVFFGDHLPMLGYDYDVYREAHFYHDDGSYEDYLNMHNVPFVVWDNLANEPEELRLSASFLGAYVLELAQKEGTSMTEFLNGLSADGSSMVTSDQFSTNGTLTAEQLQAYELLQYDLLNGEEYLYALKLESKPQPNTSYVLGDGTLEIQDTPVSVTAGTLIGSLRRFIEGKI